MKMRIRIGRRGIPIFGLVLCLILAACGGNKEANHTGDRSSDSAVALVENTPALGSVDSVPADSHPEVMMMPGGETDASMGSEGIAMPAGEIVSTPMAGGVADTSGSGASSGGGAANLPVSPLNAGEIDDNVAWDAHLSYRNDFLRTSYQFVRNLDVSQRHIITVTDPQGLPIIGARVLIYADQALITESRTYATGQTLFFPLAQQNMQMQPSYRVVVQKGQVAVEFTLDALAGHEWQVELDTTTPAGSTPLDVMFLVDSTGSMADEIAQLQNNILAISEQINQMVGDVDTRYALVTYRDRGDTYVTQTTDFVTSVTEFQSALSQVQAGGGGDTPESLNEALHVAVQEVSWRDDNAVKLIFLVADAAPHLDYDNDYDYSKEMMVAAWQGIKIHPIASSGLTPDGEFIFRQIAQYTMGRFLFLTYESGASGSPGTQRTDLEASTENNNYSVEQLDELVLRLITDELAALDTRVTVQALTPAINPTNPVAENDHPAHFAALVNRIANAAPPVYNNNVAEVGVRYSPPTGIPYVAAPIDIRGPAPSTERVENNPSAKGVSIWLLSMLSGLLFGGFLMGVILSGRLRRPKRKNNVLLVRVDEDGEIRPVK